MRKFHLALAVADLARSVADYSARLGAAPVVVVPGEYALWRVDGLNLSIRQCAETGFRHLGWEDPDAPCFSSDTDLNDMVWECFSARQQAQEINEIWPGTDYQPS